MPVRYCAIRFGGERHILAVGRDLRAMADLQLRLAEAQQAMEREYARIRNAEKRYRLLFQLSSEPVLVVDSASQRVLEANPAAANLLGLDPKKVGGQAFAELFESRSRQAAQSFVAAARVGHASIMSTPSSRAIVRPCCFRVRCFVKKAQRRYWSCWRASATPYRACLPKTPDFWVSSAPCRKLLSSPTRTVAFSAPTRPLSISCKPPPKRRFAENLLERWIGRPGVDMDVLYSNLRAHGVVRHFSTVARGEFGSNEDVEVSAVSATGSPEPCLGFTIRSVALRAGRERLGGRELPRTVEQFTDLVGRVPLKNLVRETTDLIERLCIEAALELTRDNRASAAEMLGLSRQGFYAKLRRYGLGELDDLGSPS